MSQFKYPRARRDESVIEDKYGTKVPDPYRWLEDPDSEETKSFVEAQNKITQPYLESCSYREQFSKKLTEMWDYPKFGCPSKYGDKWYYFHNTGLQNQSVMYVKEKLEEEGKVFLDPNTFSSDGTTSLSSFSFSEDGRYMAYAVSEAGSDWVSIKVRDTSRDENLPDLLKNCKFTSLSWTHDHKGFFYNTFPISNQKKSDGTETNSNENHLLFYHLLGREQENDLLCSKFPENPTWMSSGIVSDCGNYLCHSIFKGCEPVNRLYLAKLDQLSIKTPLQFIKIVDNFEAEYEYITNEGPKFTFKTNLNSPRYKLINININDYHQDKWETLVEEKEKDVLKWAECVNGNQLVLCYLRDVTNILEIRSLESGETLHVIPLQIGNIVSFSGKKKHPHIFYHFISFLTPGIIYHCDLTNNNFQSQIHKEILVKNFNSLKFETIQIFYEGKDGTKIPMFLTMKKGLEKTGNNPVFLYGYGGFNLPICPSFSVSRILFINHFNGIYAVANIRGGGEYGEEWHKGGMLEKKQNVFDDFQGAALHLISNNYTNPSKIAINGGSNGGLLVGSSTNQKPDLFGCSVAEVGVMDMLRFHKFTIGHAWMTEFGDPDNKEDFINIYKYSPLHNIPSKGPYPATLLLTGDHDDRVVPLHSLKFIAQLQYQLGSDPYQTNPLMIKIDTKSGHGAGKPTSKIIEELTDIYCFIIKSLKLTWNN